MTEDVKGFGKDKDIQKQPKEEGGERQDVGTPASEREKKESEEDAKKKEEAEKRSHGTSPKPPAGR